MHTHTHTHTRTNTNSKGRPNSKFKIKKSTKANKNNYNTHTTTSAPKNFSPLHYRKIKERETKEDGKFSYASLYKVYLSIHIWYCIYTMYANSKIWITFLSHPLALHAPQYIITIIKYLFTSLSILWFLFCFFFFFSTFSSRENVCLFVWFVCVCVSFVFCHPLFFIRGGLIFLFFFAPSLHFFLRLSISFEKSLPLHIPCFRSQWFLFCFISSLNYGSENVATIRTLVTDIQNEDVAAAATAPGNNNTCKAIKSRMMSFHCAIIEIKTTHLNGKKPKHQAKRRKQNDEERNNNAQNYNIKKWKQWQKCVKKKFK